MALFLLPSPLLTTQPIHSCTSSSATTDPKHSPAWRGRWDLEQLLLHVLTLGTSHQWPSRGCAVPLCCIHATAGNGDGFEQGLPSSKGPLLGFPRERGVEGRKAHVYVLGSGNCNFPFEFHWSFLLLFALGNQCAG